MGPATSQAETVSAMIEAGTDIFRLNFSHSNHDGHKKIIELIRDAASKAKRHIAILADIQGPKIRIGQFKDGCIHLKQKQTFSLLTDDSQLGDETQVSTNHKTLSDEVCVDDLLLLDDGMIELQVTAVKPGEVVCSVVKGGKLSDKKGLNRLGGGLFANAITEKDHEDIAFAVENKVDYIALSFVKSAKDVEFAKNIVHATNTEIGIIAKLECAESLDDLDNIIGLSSGVMVARGDLGVEMGDAELPAIQKHIISKARSLNKFVITATQMMQSMTENPIPTRAEVFDVANAVLDGTDAVMLSAETATGQFPIETIEAMAKIAMAAEKHPSTFKSDHRLDKTFNKQDEAIAMASMYTANHANVKAICAFTESGSTTLTMSRINTAIPIFAFSRHLETLRRVAIYRDVFPIHFEFGESAEARSLAAIAIKELQNKSIIEDGDLIIITRGDIIGSNGGTNRMKIVKVGDELRA